MVNYATPRGPILFSDALAPDLMGYYRDFNPDTGYGFWRLYLDHHDLCVTAEIHLSWISIRGTMKIGSNCRNLVGANVTMFSDSPCKCGFESSAKSQFWQFGARSRRSRSLGAEHLPVELYDGYEGVVLNNELSAVGDELKLTTQPWLADFREL